MDKVVLVNLLLMCFAGIRLFAFTPVDNCLIDCGSSTNTTVDKRVFVADSPGSFFSVTTGENISGNTASSPSGNLSGLDLYRTARIFTSDSSYTFSINSPGRHWIRLYFFPFSYQMYDLTTASFSVRTQDTVLLSNFRTQNTSAAVFKEYSVFVNSSSLVLTFTPLSSSFAFVNAIEVVSVPSTLIADSAHLLNTPSTRDGLSKETFETVFRVNMGGPLVTPLDDALQRTWVTDEDFLLLKSAALSVTTSQQPTYPNGGATQDTAPAIVYRTARMMNPSTQTNVIKFNMTWQFPLDFSYSYLIRMHFCDIASKAQNQLVFNVYIDGFSAVSNLDLYAKTLASASPWYYDFVLAVTSGSSSLNVSVGPSDSPGTPPNATLNGLEIMKFVLPSANPSSRKGTKIVIIVGSLLGGLVAIVLCLVAILLLRGRKKPRRDGHSNSRTRIPFTVGRQSHGGGRIATSNTGLSGHDASLGFRFTFTDLQEATINFGETSLIGVGGFGKVYKGKLRDGTVVAVKRANPGSQQGMKEFLTEIDMLSKFRHRHLVSLIGFCDEQSEMILVYEYMANGTLRSHLYGSGLPSLTWKQRLEICIGAARGLHYLHTGSTRVIIHRDVKSANILLDANLMAKVSDFGISKAGPDLDQSHVSTAVKGSFGYLDPEYFKRQQLTEKSDVYSFGVVLLEVLCARPVIDSTLPREMVNIADWAMKWQKKGKLERIIDHRLAGAIKPASLMKFGETVEKCLAEYGTDRPSMGDVLWNLEYALQLQETSSLADPDDNSATCLIDMPIRISRVDSYETEVTSIDGTSNGDELLSTSSNNVFSQLINTEGR
ncbi:receptor-like protein kinase HERK 1 [Nymphaea colorata]|uniref:receptor-like protein kinase HERK 1 n=1 Tax=Nymphaea colorata TaxID=210225 RepID=UPI00129E5C94|nr:receptor-like protein kinase HERK 1 [Nymphaea colorata]XP_049934519.1 receptor-like protein kinase HERK 1 [Nymphaea colorata]XP_049934520.1 receptor-like protein kinase HERK 1 [Nymphaea colorata]